MASSIVTVGTRHVKLWRLNQSAPSSPSKKTSQLEAADTLLPSSPGPRTLHGRNCLLGPLLEATFTCVEAISDSKSALCTERGSICVLDDSDCMQRLYQISTVDFSIKCLSVDYSTNDLLFGGKGADIRRIKLDDLDQLEAFPRKSRSSSTSSSGTASTLDESTGLIALGPLPACLVAVDSAHCVQLYSKTEPQSGWPVKLHEAPAHRSAILGVRMIGGHEFEIPRFFTWSTDGLISIWTLDGIRKADFEVSLNQSYSSDDDGPNELTVVRASDDGGFFIAGDKRGNLRLLEGDSWTSSLEAKAHVGQINDIAIVRHSEDTVLIATCGRDRTIQIFRREPSDLDLIQTIDQHTSSINQLRFLDDGSALLSSSSDRTVVMHTLATADRSMAYISTRIIVLKSTPLSMVIDPKDPNILVVSALDKQIHKFELSSGQQKQTMRLTDKESNELVPLMCLVACLVTGSETSSSVLIGGSPMDKSIRIHDAMTGTIISKAYGHSERISDLAIICRGEGPDGRPLYAIISTSLDKTIMIWDLEYSNTFSTDEDYTSAPLSGTPTVSKPLRRVLSRSSLAEYHRSLEASGISPLSSVKGQSPSRIRKKPSRYSLVQASIASPTSKPVFNSALTRQFQTAPLSPSTPVTKHKRPPLPEFHRTQSANNLSNLTDLNATVEQLYRSLAAFRKKLSATTEQLDPEMVVELQTQLAATLGDIQVKKSDARATDDSTLGQATNGVSKRELVASEEDVDGFLGMYSERLAKMVEQRVMAELTKTTREDNRCQGTGKDRDKNGIDHSPMRDEAGGHGEDEAVAIESEGKG
ncbi:hypothetical protein MMC13_000806 [Lambiella insularis]|nr:hypothetical protein [Lambiella insularis]